MLDDVVMQGDALMLGDAVVLGNPVMLGDFVMIGDVLMVPVDGNICSFFSPIITLLSFPNFPSQFCNSYPDIPSDSTVNI